MKQTEQTEQTEENQRPLDILQHFIFDNTKYEIDILWENREPLFKASDIGNILGIKEIRSVTRNFGPEEVQVRSMHTNEILRDHIVLTEVGLYRLINRSRKPIAWPFQKWVANVIKDIQKNNKYEVDDLKQELKKTQEKIISETRRATHNALLKAYRNKYVVYFGRIREFNGKILVKIGSTKDIRATFVDRHPIDYEAIELIHAIECQRNTDFEKFLLQHKDIRKYLYSGPVKKNGGKSIEVVLVDEQELKSVFRIAKANLSKFKNTLNEIGMDELNDTIQKTVFDALQKYFRLNLKIEEEEQKEPIVLVPQKKKRIREKGTGKCLGCEIDISKQAKFCSECILEIQPKKFEITKEELYDLVHVQRIPYTTIGKKYGVSDNAIRKRCRSFGVEVRKRAKKDE